MLDAERLDAAERAAAATMLHATTLYASHYALFDGASAMAAIC